MGVIELASRDAINDIKSAPQTFSSWNSCMTKAYCKWPAIAGIVIGSIIVLSILFCCFRCICCGLECCCGCFSCFNRCCPSPRGNKRSKYSDGPSYQPNAYNGGYHGYQPAPAAPPVYEAPKYAQFEAPSKKVHEDSLPAMPSWDAAATRKVEDNSHDDVEMNNLNKEAGAGMGAAAAAGAVGRQRPNQTGTQPGSTSPGSGQNPYSSTSPTSPYGANYRGSNYSRPSLPTNNSNGSQQSSAYGAHRNQQSSPYGAPQNQQSYPYGGQQNQQSSPYGSQQNGTTSQTRPYGGYRNPASADQFQSSAIAPTPQQYGATQAGNAYPSYSGAPRYESQNQYGQETGVTQASSPGSERPPSILQAGRKPVAGSWRDV